MGNTVTGGALRLISTAASPFDPSQVAGLTGAWDFSDTASITEAGGAVSQVDGAYGTSYAIAQSTGSLQPITGSRSFGGLNALEFNDDQLYVDGFPALTEWTVFAVACTDNTGGTWQAAWSSGSPGTPGTGIELGFWASGAFMHYPIAAGGYGSGTVVAGTPYIIEGLCSVSGIYTALIANGTLLIDSSSGAHAIAFGSRFSVGKWHTTYADNLDGAIGEVLVYDSQLGAGDRTLIRDYLNAKWAVY